MTVVESCQNMTEGNGKFYYAMLKIVTQNLCNLMWNLCTGVGGSGKGQGQVALSAGIKYYTTVRALTGAGSVLESVSDGFLVDVTAPVPVIKSTGGVALNLTDRATTSTIYQKEVDSFTAAWVVNDPESGVSDVWFRLGTYPGRSCKDPWWGWGDNVVSLQQQ